MKLKNLTLPADAPSVRQKTTQPVPTMKTETALACRAQKMLYLLHNSGRYVPVALMQMLADVAKRNGSTAPMVLNYADGNTNGR